MLLQRQTKTLIWCLKQPKEAEYIRIVPKTSESRSTLQLKPGKGLTPDGTWD